MAVQVWRGQIWHGCYSKETAKPQWFYSNDETLLQRLCIAAGYLPVQARSQFLGQPLAKRARTDAGNGWTGVKDRLKESQ